MGNIHAFFRVAAVFYGLAAATSAQAALLDNLDGTITELRADGSEIMWLKDANAPGVPLTWDEARSWTDSLSFAGYDDWRLPSAGNAGGAPCTGYNCADGELGNLYYNELNNAAIGSVFGQTNTGPFINLAGYLWSGTPSSGSGAYDFNFDFGSQYDSYTGYLDNVIALRTVRTAVPEPSTLLLTASGAFALFYFRKKRA